MPDGLAVEQGDLATALLLEGELEGARHGRLARAEETGEEDGEALLFARGARLSQNANNLGVREPLGDRGASLESAA